jgi:hypothetical protein
MSSDENSKSKSFGCDAEVCRTYASCSMCRRSHRRPSRNHGQLSPAAVAAAAWVATSVNISVCMCGYRVLRNGIRCALRRMEKRFAARQDCSCTHLKECGCRRGVTQGTAYALQSLEPRLHLCRGMRPHHKYPALQFDVAARVSNLRAMC